MNKGLGSNLSLGRKLGSLILWAALPFFAVPSFARAQLGDEFSYQDLKQIISAQKVKSLAELLPYLPESTRENFSLVYKSRSVQPASAVSPRVILARADGGLALAFSTLNPESLEVLEFNSVTGKLEPRMIRFISGAEFIDDPVEYFANSPMRCTRCHSERLHFVWDAYPRWPGVFGHNDRLKSADARIEKAAFARLQAGADQTLLRYLPGLKELSFEAMGKRNIRMSTLLGRTNSKRVATLITETPRFMEYRALMLAALIDDPKFEYYLSKKDQATYQARLKEMSDAIVRMRDEYTHQLNARQKETGEEASLDERLQEAFLRKSELPMAARLMFAAEKMGLSTHDWWMTLEPSTFAVSDGRLGLMRELIPAFIDVLRQTDPKVVGDRQLVPLRAFFKMKEWYSVARTLQMAIWKASGSSQKFPAWYSPAGIKVKCEELLRFEAI